MKIFVLYDDEKEKDLLKRIILNNDLGYIAGESNNINELMEDIGDIKPDLIIFSISMEAFIIYKQLYIIYIIIRNL